MTIRAIRAKQIRVIRDQTTFDQRKSHQQLHELIYGKTLRVLRGKALQPLNKG